MTALTAKTIEQYEDHLAMVNLFGDGRAALLAFAADPATGAQDLYRLYRAARYGREIDREVRKRIASNPGIGVPEHYWYIAWDHPAELALNPAFQQALERDPATVQYWESELTNSLLEVSPPSVAAAVVATAEAITFALLREQEFSEAHFRAMLPVALPAWRGELLQNPYLPADLHEQPND